MTLTAIGFVLFANLTTTSSYAYILVAIFPFATGLSLTMSPMTSSIRNAASGGSSASGG